MKEKLSQLSLSRKSIKFLNNNADRCGNLHDPAMIPVITDVHTALSASKMRIINMQSLWHLKKIKDC